MICKNCGDNTKGKYCQSCGQKTDTHRLTLRHFFMHDLLHGFFHLDSGLPRTIKEILIRPGHVAHDYIFGKRKKYYNFFYLLLLIIGVYLFLKSFEPTATIKEVVDNNKFNMAYFFKQNIKAVIFSWIPILALSGFIVFRRLKLTLLEFFIPAVIAVIGASFFNILFVTINLLPQKYYAISIISSILDGLDFVFGFSVFLFPFFVFGHFIKGNYSFLGAAWRLFVFLFISIIILFCILAFINSIKSGTYSASLHFSP